MPAGPVPSADPSNVVLFSFRDATERMSAEVNLTSAFSNATEAEFMEFVMNTINLISNDPRFSFTSAFRGYGALQTITPN